MRGAAALVLMLGSSACAAPQLQPDLPVLLRFQPPERGGPTALPEASPSGIVDLSGPCVALRTGTSGSTVIIASARASVGRDARGPYLQFGSHRFRHGDWAVGGGGYFDQLPVWPLQSAVPPACSTGSYLIFSGAKPPARSSAPPRSPPPPPTSPERD